MDKDECAEDEIIDYFFNLNLSSQTFRCILPDEERVALVIGGLRMTDNEPLLNIEVYNTFNVKG